MFKSLKNKLLVTISISLALMLLLIGINIFSEQKTKLLADSTNITVTKGKIDLNKSSTEDGFFADLDTTYFVNNNDIVMLDDINSGSTGIYEGLKVSFGLPDNADEKIIAMNTTLTLNGVPMDTDETMSSQEQTKFEQFIYYNKIMKTNYPSGDQKELTEKELQGLYTYTFRYLTDLSNTERVSTISFYLISSNDYFADNVTPILNNTEKIDRDYYISAVEQNFYHFEKTDYPTYSFDASKYNLSWAYSLHGVTYNYTTYFKVENGEGVLEVYKNNVLQPNFKVIIENEQNIGSNYQTTSNFYCTIEFSNVGEYNFNLLPVVANRLVENGTINYTVIEEANAISFIVEQWKKLGDVDLDIFGYQLYYTNYNRNILDENGQVVEDLEFKNEQYNANVTPNISNLDDFSVSNDASFADVEYLFNENIVTNQAPVSFAQYFATMGYDSQKLESKSYYAYFQTENSTAVINELTNSTKFSNNGYYILLCTYGYINYEHLVGDDNNKTVQSYEYDSDDDFKQVFAFRINNVEPDVTLETEDGQFYANEITNKDVTLSYTVSKFFDVEPNFTFQYSFNNSTFVDAVLGTDYEMENDKFIFKAKDNSVVWWKVTMQYGPNQSTTAVYRFITDTTPITSEAFKIETQQDTSSNYFNKYFKSTKLEGSFIDSENKVEFIKTHNNFFVSYTGTKDSGAEIHSNYLFIDLQKTALHDIYNENNTNNFENIFNGYSLTSTATIYKYGLANLDGENYLLNENSNYVLTNAGLYIFRFNDDAGNINYKVVLLDNSSPVVLIDEDLDDNSKEYKVLENNYSIYLNSVNIVYGQNKAINAENLNKMLTDNTANQTLKTFISENSWLSTIYSNNYILTPINIEKTLITTKSTGNIADIPYGKALLLQKQEDEAEYAITIEDSLGNILLNKTVKLSTDNSLLTAYYYDELANGNLKTDFALSEFKTSSNTYLYLSWVNNVGDYEISSLNLDFYPLTYDVNSANYPYSEASTNSVNLLENNSSATVNEVLSVFISKPIQTEGMYVITRTYKNELPDGSLDMSTRKYIFFIDRNDIFKNVKLTDSTFNMGETISLNVGPNITDYNIVLNSNDFILNGKTNKLFSTNKLPVNLLIDNFASLNKYSIKQDLTNASNNTSILQNIHISSKNVINNNTPNWLDVIKYAHKLNVLVKKDNINVNSFSYNNSGNYEISIKDSSSNAIEYKLLFTINEVLPNGDFIRETTNGYISLEESPVINYSEDIKFVWKNPTDKYSAVIDSTKVKVYVNGQEIVAEIIQTDPALNLDWDYEINLSTLMAFEKNNDYVIEIYLEYIGNDGYASYSKTEFITLDFTAPDLNYERLFSTDNFLAPEQKAGFDDYNSEINFENYTFTIDGNFVFQADGNNKTNTQEIYYRRYNKYEEIINSEDYVNLQSLVPDDDRYEDLDTYKRLRFASYLTDTYTSIGIATNNTIGFATIVNNNYGYYEIIEVDKAGNARIYSVYLPHPENQITFDYTYSANNQQITNSSTLTGNADEVVEVPSTEITLNNIITDNKLWANVQILKNNTSINTFKLSPISLNGYITLEELITYFNELALNVDDVNGTSYSLIIKYNTICDKNLYGEEQVYNLTYAYPSAQLELIFGDSLSGTVKLLSVKIPTNKNGTKIDDIVVKLFTNGSYQPLEEDYYGKEIQAIENETYYFNVSNGGDFQFEITDNFNRTYSTRRIVGLEDVASLEFNNEYVLDEDTYYTANQTYVVYQAGIYNISIYSYDDEGNLNPTPLSALELEELKINSTVRANALTYVSLFNTSNKEIQKYHIVLTDGLENGKVVSYTVMYIPTITTVEVKDNSGQVLFTNTSNNAISVTSRTCYVYINETLNIPAIKTQVIAKLESNGIITELGEIANGTCLSEIGNYSLTIYNSLGTVSYINFEIRNSVSKDVSVITSQGEILTASETKLTFGNEEIDWFLTIYDYNIELSSIRYIYYELVQTMHDNATKIYKLYNEDRSNEKHIAVTKVATNSNFINSYDNNLLINNTVATTTQTTSTDDNIIVSIKTGYNMYEGNNIIVKYSYNNSPLQILNGTSFRFTEAGVYQFYFSDFAGNTQMFNNQTYYKVMLFNEIIVLVNGKQKIQNSVFNSSVTVSIQEPAQYGSGANFQIVATKNKQPITVRRINNSYTFTEYGVYNIKITGNLKGKALSTTFNFVILNDNEAYVSYEYIAYSNYEITKIVRNGVNVTQEIKEQLSSKLFNTTDAVVNTISSVALSGLENGIGGNGRYTLTVLARNINTNINNEFSFNVWINSDDEVYILSSVDAGDETTKNITLRVNTSQIYQKIGECEILLNNKVWIKINSDGSVTDNSEELNVTLSQESTSTIAFATYNLTKNGSYNIKVKSLSGNTIMSFTVTKNEPLNSTAIFVIVISVVAVIAIVTVFLILRKRMRVK